MLQTILFGWRPPPPASDFSSRPASPRTASPRSATPTFDPLPLPRQPVCLASLPGASRLHPGIKARIFGVWGRFVTARPVAGTEIGREPANEGFRDAKMPRDISSRMESLDLDYQKLSPGFNPLDRPNYLGCGWNSETKQMYNYTYKSSLSPVFSEERDWP